MKITIVTVCYNAEKTIERTIESVLSQTYNDIEYIIIDGASTDDTLDIAYKYKEKIKIISEPDNGLYDAMNKGVNASCGDYIMFLNADDKFYDNRVVEKFAKKCEQKQTDLVYGNLAFYEKNRINIQRHPHLNKIYLIKNTPQQPATFYKKNVFTKVGLFDVNLKIVADQEWFLRAFLKHKISSCYLDEVVTMFSTEGLSNSKEHQIKHEYERQYMFSRYFSPVQFSFYSFVAKYLRSLSTFPILSLFFKI